MNISYMMKSESYTNITEIGPYTIQEHKGVSLDNEDILKYVIWDKNKRNHCCENDEPISFSDVNTAKYYIQNLINKLNDTLEHEI